MGSIVTNKPSRGSEPSLDKEGPSIVTEKPVGREPPPSPEKRGIDKGKLQADKNEEQVEREEKQQCQAFHQGQPGAAQEKLWFEILIFILYTHSILTSLSSIRILLRRYNRGLRQKQRQK